MQFESSDREEVIVRLTLEEARKLLRSSQQDEEDEPPEFWWPFSVSEDHELWLAIRATEEAARAQE